MEFALGNYLTLTSPAGATYNWQNFFINETVNGYSFVPFGFSGITINRQGDNVDATLAFPNNELSRRWSIEALREGWLADVKVMLLNPADRSQQEQLHSYTGQIAGGGWSETTLTLKLNTVLDAVGAEVPKRRLRQRLVGQLPMTSNVRLR
jgi:hypothetical protein